MENGLEIWKKYVSNTWHKGVIPYGEKTKKLEADSYKVFESSVIPYGEKT